MDETPSLLSPVSASRLHHLESKVTEDVGKAPDIICELKSQVESFKRKLEVGDCNAVQSFNANSICQSNAFNVKEQQ